MSIPTRAEVVKATKEAGGRIAAVLPIHYPRELLRAYGFQPMEVWGPPHIAPSKGGSHFQAYTCGIVQNATSFLLQGGLAPASALLVPHTCDALQGMGSVLRDFLDAPMPVLTFEIPRGEHDAGTAYLIEELKRLAAQLEEISGLSPTAEELAASIEREERADHELADLALNRRSIALDDRAFYTLLRSREYLPAESFCHHAEAAPRGDSPTSGVPIMLSGIVPEPMALFDHLGDAGAHVVADDLAGCSRRLYPASTESDPFLRIAKRLLGAPPDPTRGSSILSRVEAIAARMEETGAKGLLVYDVKFCEPELFDLPLIKKHLGERGYPLLHIEVDLKDSLPQQALTRIEAFIETLQ